ncbi:heterokaryon incompatibility protein-domain-containing protein [Aspergillus avenaceus]|uniref:Heterokaryon incompatibility protein-domain-containing protein n=1 Tax=Aspergillus avenaceus TaxID=36643 RepID=A0A5N6TW67_ASPAV|nr:heterokaryon incompatibility protein-domain-containing protein [Aspergillus avenaceus]
MELDIDRKLGEVFGSLDGLIEKMLEIQESVIPRDNFSHWAHHLRFIEVPSIDKAGLDESLNQTRTLNLTNKNDFPGETNYLAVSYCWNSFEKSDGTQAYLPYRIQTDRGIRQSRAPRSVLERSISYAIAQSIRFVWIDQECIDQDDPLDLEQGIQCMDQVYRSAKSSIGLLNTEFHTKSSLQIFKRMLSHIRNKSNRLHRFWETSWYDPGDPQSLSDLNHLLSEISADRWFRRNWTYQEASCTQGKMQLLIPHAFGERLLATDRRFNEVSLQLYELFDVVSVINNAVHKCLPRPLSGAKNGIMRPMSGLYMQAWDQARRKTRPQSYEVASQMMYRENSVVADRLAITANLCEYAKIIDPALFRLKHYSYSICAFALALVNGDIIPSSCSNMFATTGKPVFYWEDKSVYDFIASPIYVCTMHADPDQIEQRFDDVKIRREGLETSGWLWIVDRKVELRKVKETHHNLLTKIQWRRDLTSLSASLKVLLADILDELQQLNFVRMASTLCMSIGVGNYEDSAVSSQNALEGFTANHYCLNHWLFDMMESLLERGYLWCGRLDGEEEHSSIFHCDGPTTVFTGSAIAFSHIPRPWMAQNFISCEVIPRAQSAEGVTELVHTMESIHGIWHSVENTSKRFMFPWGYM